MKGSDFVFDSIDEMFKILIEQNNRDGLYKEPPGRIKKQISGNKSKK